MFVPVRTLSVQGCVCPRVRGVWIAVNAGETRLRTADMERGGSLATRGCLFPFSAEMGKEGNGGREETC